MKRYTHYAGGPDPDPMGDWVKYEDVENLLDKIYSISAFLVGEGDVAEIAARRLRALVKEGE
jgi:hypothetical protein